MNKNISNIHLDVLDKEKLELLEKLTPLAKGFILGGGTALSLQLAHRKSFDFDFFSNAPIAKNLTEKLSLSIPISNIAVDSADELTFFTKVELKVSFISYPFGNAFPILELENGLRMFSVGDVAIKKAYTIGRRGEYRDYFDLYTILKGNYISLPQIISEAKKIYGSIFEEKMFLEQLVYFGDLLNFDLVSVNSRPLPKPAEVKRFFEELIKKYIG